MHLKSYHEQKYNNKFESYYFCVWLKALVKLPVAKSYPPTFTSFQKLVSKHQNEGINQQI